VSATARLLRRLPNTTIEPWISAQATRIRFWDCQDIGDPSGINCEEGEFLYGLIRILKPMQVLETGTNIGVSTMYMALAMQDNGGGNIITVEGYKQPFERAMRHFELAGLTEYVTQVGGMSTSIDLARMRVRPDFMWLDTELDIRFKELVMFYPFLTPGGFIAIHDCPRLDVKEFGPVPDTLLALIQEGKLRVMHFITNRGVTLFQKPLEDCYTKKIMEGQV
jgi:hypothetical protein